jgi:DNA repair exonuclease SbcCD ATPase subunit
VNNPGGSVDPYYPNGGGLVWRPAELVAVPESAAREQGVQEQSGVLTGAFSAPQQETLPCAYCGRPVPQSAGTRPVRYCQDNEGACLRATVAHHLRHRDAPGLTGQVSQAREMVERLERMADQLSDSITSELSIAGLELRVGEIQAEVAAQVAAAQAAQQEAQADARAARDEAAQARVRAEQAERAVADREQVARQTVADRETLRSAYDEVRQKAEEASVGRRAAEEERERQFARATELARSLDTTRAEASALRAKLADMEAHTRRMQGAATTSAQETEEVRRRLQQVEKAREAAERAAADAESEAARSRTRLDDLARERDKAMSELRQVRSDLESLSAKRQERELLMDQLAEALSRHQSALQAVTSERDAAVAETNRIRSQVDQITRNLLAKIPGQSPLPEANMGSNMGWANGQLR